MSNHKRSLALEEELKAAQKGFERKVPLRHLSISNPAVTQKQVKPVIKVSGTITISF